MIGLEMKINAIAQIMLADTDEQMQAAKDALRDIMQGEYVAERISAEYTNLEDVIRDILLDLGAPDHQLGHPYVVRAIQLVVSNQMFLNNITLGLYPQLAAEFDTTAARVERSIRHLIETTWMVGDPDVLSKYFGNTVSADRAKPTNGQFIARVANIVKQRTR